MRQYLRRLETPLSAHHTVAGCDGPGDCVCANLKQREVKTNTGHRTHLAMRPCPDSEMTMPRDYGGARNQMGFLSNCHSEGIS